MLRSAWKRMSPPPTPGWSEGDDLCDFWELTAISDLVKTSVEYKQRICKETKVYEPLILKKGASKPVDMHVRTRKKFKVCVCSPFPTMICGLFLSSWRRRLSLCTVFLSLGDYFLPLSSLTESSVRPLFTTAGSKNLFSTAILHKDIVFYVKVR